MDIKNKLLTPLNFSDIENMNKRRKLEEQILSEWKKGKYYFFKNNKKYINEFLINGKNVNLIDIEALSLDTPNADTIEIISRVSLNFLTNNNEVVIKIVKNIHEANIITKFICNLHELNNETENIFIYDLKLVKDPETGEMFEDICF